MRARNLESQGKYLLPNVRELRLGCMPDITLAILKVGFIDILFSQSILLMAITVSIKLK